MTKINPETELKIAKIYKQGLSMHEIARRFRVSSGTIYTHLKKHVSIKERKERKQHRLTIDEKLVPKFCKFYIDGLSSIEIAKKFKTNPDIVLYHLKKTGIDTSHNGKYKRKIDTEKLDRIVATYRENGSILKTAKVFDLHPSSVYNRLKKLGIVKNKLVNQKIAKEKYILLTDILIQLFEKMQFQVRYVQRSYNGHGPDMVIENDNKVIIIEHKATVKRSMYWQHGIEEAERGMKKLNIKEAWIVTTAQKPKGFKKNEMKVIFCDDLKKLLEENGLNHLLDKIDYISSTPSV